MLSRSPNCWHDTGDSPTDTGRGQTIVVACESDRLGAVRRAEGLSGWLLLFALMCLGCDTPRAVQPAAAETHPVIVVTSYPLLAMVQAVAGELIDAELIVPRTTTSRNWRPSADAVQEMQRASRILISGGDYEPWMQRVTLPRSRLIDTAIGYYDEFIRIPDAVIHQHGPDGRHSHAGTVWATWLDPELAESQLQQVKTCLEELLPDQRNRIRAAAEEMDGELQHLDHLIRHVAAATAESSILALGDAPVYQCLIRRLGWSLQYVHLPDTGPLSEERQKELTDAIAAEKPAIVLVRSTLWEQMDELRPAVDVPFVSVDLCEFPDSDQSLTSRLRGNMVNISRALEIELP